MVRPKDYGDQFPSDTGDLVPNSPTAGFEEIDPQIFNDFERRAARIDLAEKYNFEDEADSGFIPVDTDKHAYYGYLLKEISSPTDYPRTFDVLLHTGKTIRAQSLDLKNTEKYDDGANAIVIPGKDQNTWYLQAPVYKASLARGTILTTFDITESSGSSIQKIALNKKGLDRDLVTNLNDNRIEILAQGDYLIEGNGDLQLNADNTNDTIITIELRKNGNYLPSPFDGLRQITAKNYNFPAAWSISRYLTLEPGDYIELWCQVVDVDIRHGHTYLNVTGT